jgi:hypothetical protein
LVEGPNVFRALKDSAVVDGAGGCVAHCRFGQTILY